MKLRRGQAVLALYAIVIVGSIVYFGVLQGFGYKGLEFRIEGRDRVFDMFDILIMIGTIAAFVLFVISLMAYRRSRDLRVLVVSMAFFFFAVKELLGVLSNFFPNEFIYIDHAADVLNLLILLSFIMLMYGVSSRYEKSKSRH